MNQLAVLEKNVALVNDLDTWGGGFGGACDLAKELGAARIVVQIEENLVERPGTNPDFARIAQALWIIRGRGLVAGTWTRVPPTEETPGHYAKRQSDYIGALQKVKIDAAGDVVKPGASDQGAAQGPSEHMLDLEANWPAAKMDGAVRWLRQGDPAQGIISRTLLMTTTHEPGQDETKVHRNALAALGIRAFYEQLYGAKPGEDRRDPLYQLAVSLGSAAREPGIAVGHHQIKMMIATGYATQQVVVPGPGNVGTYASRLPLTGCRGVAYYLMDTWANQNSYLEDKIAYRPLTGLAFSGEANLDRRVIVIGHRA